MALVLLLLWVFPSLSTSSSRSSRCQNCVVSWHPSHSDLLGLDFMEVLAEGKYQYTSRFILLMISWGSSMSSAGGCLPSTSSTTACAPFLFPFPTYFSYASLTPSRSSNHKNRKTRVVSDRISRRCARARSRHRYQQRPPRGWAFGHRSRRTAGPGLRRHSRRPRQRPSCSSGRQRGSARTVRRRRSGSASLQRRTSSVRGRSPAWAPRRRSCHRCMITAQIRSCTLMARVPPRERCTSAVCQCSPPLSSDANASV